MRHSSLLRRLPDAARDLIHNHVVMRCVAADQAAKADDGIIFPGFGKSASGQGNFERSGDADQRDVFLPCARAQQSVVSALEEPFCDEGVEARNDNRTPLSSSAKPTLDSRNRRLRRTLDFYFLFRGFLRASVSLW